MKKRGVRVPGLLLGVLDGGASLLERRVMALLEGRLVWGWRWRLVSAVGCVAVMGAASLGVGMLAVRGSLAQAMAAPLDVPRVEVASVKPSGPDEVGSSVGMRTDAVFADNATLVGLLEEVYPHQLVNTGQIVGVPEWGKTQRYDVVGKVGGADVAKLKGLGERRGEMESALLQQVLVSRFSLKAHEEERPGQVYELVLAKGGMRLKAGDPEKEMDEKSQKNVPHGFAIGGAGVMARPGQIVGHAVTMDQVVHALMRGGKLDRTVVDKTGLSGRYDFILYWTPEGSAMTEDSGPSFFTAVEEQMGLKLVPVKAPVKVLVVDRVERPSEN